MNQPTFDLSACEREPIRTPGSVQAHAALLAVQADGGVGWASESAAAVLGVDPESLLGRPWDPAAIDPVLAGPVPEAPEQRHELLVRAGGRLLDAVGHRHAGCIIWEFLPAQPDPGGACPVPAWESAGGAPLNPYRAAQHAVGLLRTLTGYDRVMAYRFHPDWTGEVIAEARKAEAVPFLGLRYPASDIPSQARELYRRNLVRSIDYVHGVACALRCAPGAGQLDLSHAVARAVSPYHLEYLANMGVAATLAVSLMVEGELWGMLVCHHDRPRSLPWAVRRAAGRLGASLARWLADDRARTARAATAAGPREEARLAGEFATSDGPDLLAALLGGPLRLRTLLDADGAAVVVGDELAAIGATPDPGWLRCCAAWLHGRAGREAVATDRLPPELPPPAAGEEVCGLIGIALPGDGPPAALLVFRQEVVQEVHWGGDPSIPALIDAQQRLSPRRSFALWRETVRGSARPWCADQVRRLATLARILGPAAAPRLGEALSRLRATGPDGDWLAVQLLDAVRDGVALAVRLRRAEPARVVLANHGFCRLFGIDPLEAGPQPLDALLARIGLSAGDLAGGRRVECWTAGRGHRVLLADVRRCAAIDGSDGALAWLTVRFDDVTVDQRLTDAMAAARDQAVAARVSQSAILSNMSHELRTPLNAIIGFSELLSLGGDDAATHADYIAQIRSAGDHLLGLVNDILDLAKLESGRMSLSEEVLDLAAVLREAAAWVRPLAEAGEVRLVLAVPPGPARLRGERRRLMQIVVNLLSNAIKFSPRNAEIACAVQRLPDGATALEVRDHGVGIPPEHLARVFDRFHQVDSTPSRPRHGTGLGLSIVKALTELHGGRVELSSAVGIGTRVRVCLPAWRTVPEEP
jgi:light-regulated signal transduction histidine kinase (bacteriophytochrome)